MLESSPSISHGVSLLILETARFIDEEAEVKLLNSPWVISALSAGKTQLSPLYESSKLFIQWLRGLNRQFTKVEKQWIYQYLEKISALFNTEM